MVFTHSGITGPAVFALSAAAAFEPVSAERPFSVRLVPDASKRFEAWDVDLAAAFGNSGAREAKNVLAAYFPHRFAEKLPAFANFAGEKKSATVSKDERRALARVLAEGLPIRLSGRRAGEEFVTA